MKIRITLGDWDSQREDAQAIRREVFVVEQSVPISMEWDDMDDVSLHAVAYGPNHQAIGTGRLLPDGHIGRMAVRKSARRAGVGSAILQELMRCAAKRGDKEVVLHAQTRAQAFYLQYGFTAEGEVFEEAGIPHIRMRRVFVERAVHERAMQAPI
jgi:predicted GNAT family N-acyltransferase